MREDERSKCGYDTMRGEIQHDGAWHLVSINFPVGMLPKAPDGAALEREARVEQLLAGDLGEPYSERT